MVKRPSILGALVAAVVAIFSGTACAQSDGNRLTIEDSMGFSAYRTTRARASWSKSGRLLVLGQGRNRKTVDPMTGEVYHRHISPKRFAAEVPQRDAHRALAQILFERDIEIEALEAGSNIRGIIARIGQARHMLVL